MDILKDRMTITMPPDIRKKLKELAKQQRRSESSMIHWLIEEKYNKNK